MKKLGYPNRDQFKIIEMSDSTFVGSNSGFTLARNKDGIWPNFVSFPLEWGKTS